ELDVDLVIDLAHEAHAPAVETLARLPCLLRLFELVVADERTDLDARNALKLRADLFEIGIRLVTQADAIAAGAQLELDGARILGTPVRGKLSAAFGHEAEVIADLLFFGLTQHRDFLHANQETIRVVLVRDLQDVRRIEAGLLDRRSNVARRHGNAER